MLVGERRTVQLILDRIGNRFFDGLMLGCAHLGQTFIIKAHRLKDLAAHLFDLAFFKLFYISREAMFLDIRDIGIFSLSSSGSGWLFEAMVLAAA